MTKAGCFQKRREKKQFVEFVLMERILFFMYKSFDSLFGVIGDHNTLIGLFWNMINCQTTSNTVSWSSEIWSLARVHNNGHG